MIVDAPVTVEAQEREILTLMGSTSRLGQTVMWRHRGTVSAPLTMPSCLGAEIAFGAFPLTERSSFSSAEGPEGASSFQGPGSRVEAHRTDNGRR